MTPTTFENFDDAPPPNLLVNPATYADIVRSGQDEGPAADQNHNH